MVDYDLFAETSGQLEEMGSPLEEMQNTISQIFILFN
jgi:hypothetical protein